jgi:acyl-lipid omega-6 desaturase (Delta-12 desaturase)
MQEKRLTSLRNVYGLPGARRVTRGNQLQITKTGHYPAELRDQVIALYDHCRHFAAADNMRALGQIATTAAIFVPLVVLMLWLNPLQQPLALLLAIPIGGLLTRFFALQHDCGHGSFFSSKRANEVTGQIISLLTFTPYDHWRRCHAQHHAASGNLERRGIGDIETMTVSEYQSLSRGGQWRYRIMRHPLVALVIGPPVYFFILQRMAIWSVEAKRDVLPGVMLHNLALLLFYGGLCWWLGTGLVLSVVVSSALVGSWIGGWLFFVQHQFEETLWDGADRWDVKIAALKGSSHLQLPAALNWLTCDIGLHHIHHLLSRVPNYHLRACMKASVPLQSIAPKLTLWKAITSLHLGLWDELERRLISFGEYNRKYA